MIHGSIIFLFLLRLLKTLQAQTLVNVAEGKTCDESSMYMEDSHGNGCTCAINGNTSTAFAIGDCHNGGNCIHTNESDLTPRWSVDLGRTYLIQKITVIGRGDQLLRMREVNVYVDNNNVYTFSLSQTNLTTEITGRSLPLQGQHVILLRDTQNTILYEYKHLFLNFCEVQVWVFSACASNPCQHRGTCQSTSVDVYSCLCQEGYTDTNCQTNIDDCASRPCRNGGTCNDHVASYTCTCLRGYSGPNCEMDINECASRPCLNGGTCNDRVDSYTCTCASGYTGTNCQADIDECAPRPCHNGGICNNLVASFTCTCLSGYTGPNCQTDIDECLESLNPCNPGNCSNTVGSYTCQCPGGFNGTLTKSCIDVNECDVDSSLCQPGNCSNTYGSFNCSCPQGYAGTNNCTDIDDCVSSNCTNGASCTDGVASFTCTCPNGYNGTYCETALPQYGGPEVSSSPAIGAGVGAAVAVILVVILVILIVRLYM